MPDETRSTRLGDSGDFATNRPSGGITGVFAPAACAALYLCSGSKAKAALVASLAASGCLCAEDGVAGATGTGSEAAPTSSSMPTISL